MNNTTIIYTKHLLIKKLKEISAMGFVPNARSGNAGGIGNTIEDLLGIEENNLPVLGRKWDKIKALKHEIPDLDYHNKTHRNGRVVCVEGIQFGSVFKAQKYFTCSRQLIISKMESTQFL